MAGPGTQFLLRSGPRRFVAWTSSTAVVLVKQARHVVFLHEGTGGGEALRGELLGGDAGAEDVFGLSLIHI